MAENQIFATGSLGYSNPQVHFFHSRVIDENLFPYQSSHLIFRLEEIQIKVHNPQIHKSLIFNGKSKSISDLEIRVAIQNIMNVNG